MPGRFDKDNYIDVQDRINRFWKEYPEGAIRTRIMSPPDDFSQCRFEAQVFKHWDNSGPVSTGWAFEIAGTGGANNGSHEENCETSAIGRALANMGYATSRLDRPSRQEMDKVDRALDAAEVPARTRTTTQNTVPDVTVGTTNTVNDWSAFWKMIEGMGLPRDKKALEQTIGESIGISPAMALEKVQAWAHDQTIQKAMA